MKKIILSLVLAMGAILTGCNDSFLEKYPVTDLTEKNAFKSYDNFKAFMWPCYKIFSDKDIATSITSFGQDSHYRGDLDAGYLEQKGVAGYNKYAFQNVVNATSGNGWNFSNYIRRVNIMLSHIEDSEMTTAEKEHWQSVGYFFHSFWYMELISRFGDVPWVEKVLDESSPEAYGARMPRAEVAAKVLERLKWAEEHIADAATVIRMQGANTINRDCVRAAISRFALREATWIKYHEGAGNSQMYLDECIRVSKLLMADYPTLYQGTDGQPAAGYGEMWTTDDLSKVPGVILYLQWLPSIKPGHACYYEHTSSHNIEMHQGTVDLYLSRDGKTISNTAGYSDKNMYATFRNRDPRMYHTIMPPYQVQEKQGDYNTWSFSSNPADREYIDIMGRNESCSNPGVGMKRLPGQNWSASLLRRVPNLVGGGEYTIEGKKYTPQAFVSCRSGYYVWKNWNNWEENFNSSQMNTADKPIFKIEEVLLNYAEAMFEAGKFDQTVANASINLLRSRAGVAPMTVADIDATFDPKRGKYYPKGNDAGILVDPVLWEIRRERIVELMGEGFGFYDVRRWRMAPWFVNMQQKGMWVSKSELKTLTLLNETTGTDDGINGQLTEGYIFLFNDPVKAGKGWLEKYYLYQIPLEEIGLNPSLKPNNPGWE